MSVVFKVRDVMRSIAVKFVHAFLPDAKKPYNIKAVHQTELDIHDIASKAEVYNITTDPEIIEEGLTVGMELIYYLAAEGYKIKTPLFTLKIRLPGELPKSLWLFGLEFAACRKLHTINSWSFAMAKLLAIRRSRIARCLPQVHRETHPD